MGSMVLERPPSPVVNRGVLEQGLFCRMTQRVWNALHSASDKVSVAWPSPEKAGTTCSIRIEVALLSSWGFGGTRDGTGFLRNQTDVGSLSGRASMRYSRIFPNRETSEATTWIYMLTLKETFQHSYKYTFLNFYYNHACEGRGPSWNQFKDLLRQCTGKENG